MIQKPSIERKDRARRAVELKVAGATWPQIADELGYKTEAGPRLAVVKYFEDTANRQLEEMHPILMERGEALWRKAWAKLNQLQAANAPMDQWDRAMRQCVSVLQSLARISGYGDGPLIQVNVTSSADVRKLRDEFLQLRTPEPAGTIDGELADDEDDE